MRTWQYLVRLVWLYRWPLTTDLILEVLAFAVLMNLVGLLQREIFNHLTGDSQAFFGIWELCAILVAVNLGSNALGLAAVITHWYSIFQVRVLLQRNTFAYLMDLPGHKSLPASTGEAVNRIKDDANDTSHYIGEFKFLLSNVALAVIGVVIMARISAAITFGVFLPLFIIVIVANIARRWVEQYRRRSRETTGDVTGFIGEAFGTIEAIKVASAEERVMGRLDELGDVRMRATLKDAVLDSSLNAVFSNVQAVGMGFVLIVASQAMRSGSFTVGDLSLFIFYLGHMNGFARDFGHLMTRYGQIGVSIDRLVKLMPGAGPGALIAPGPTYLTGDLPTVVQTERVAGDRLENLDARSLTYEYPQSGRGIRDVDLTLERGTFTVVTGRIGSGKTTLLSLSQKSELVMGMSLGVPSKRHQLGRW